MDDAARGRVDDVLRRFKAEDERRNGNEPASPLKPVRVADVKARPVRWLWERFLPLEKPSALAGREGIGKGLLVAWLAARVTRGELEGDLHDQARDVLIVGDEDAISDTWKWRLHAAGADNARVHILTDELDITNEKHVEALEEWIRAHEIALVIFDALLDQLGGAETDEYRPKHIRNALKPLRRLAADTGCAALGVLHPPKGSAVSYRDAVAGSHQLVAAMRSGLLLAQHPESEDGRELVLARGKGNLSAPPTPLELRIEAHLLELDGHAMETPFVAGFEPSDATLDDLLSGMKSQPEQRMVDALRAAGRSLTADELMERCKVSRQTITRWAKKLTDAGEIRRSGGGHRGSPHRFEASADEP